MEKIKQVLVWLLMILMIFGVMGSSVFGATVNDDSTINLKIIHTNDTHSRYTYSVNQTIGFAKLKTIINRENPDLTVDAGDIFHGQSFATIKEGGSIAELMAAVGYDAMAPGNHDFNYGSSRLLELGTAAKTKILGANVSYTDSGNPFFEDPYLIKEINIDGKIIKIGVFGLISPDIYSATAPANVAGLTFGNRETTVATAKELVATLEGQGCDVIVALTHIGDSNGGELMRSDAIAQAVSGIDVIVDGHTHDVENREVNGALIVQTGCYSSAVGEVEITIKENDVQFTEETAVTQKNEPVAIQAVESTYTVESKVATLTSVAQATDDLIPADETVANLIAALEAEEEPIKDEVIGNTPVKLGGNTGNIWEDVRLGELNLGRVLTDSYLFTTGADIAVENAGGIRAEIAAGDITMGQVIDVLPFGNYLVTKKVSGADILSMLETSIEIGVNDQIARDKNDNSWPSYSGSYLQWGGIKAQYDLSKPKGDRVYSAEIGGIDLDAGQMYTVACNNYLATSSDYPELKAADEMNEYAACDEAFTGYLQGTGNERLLNAINNSNITEARMPEPVPKPQPVKPEQKQSSNNPKTGVRESGLLKVLLEVLFSENAVINLKK
ncbi:bifunctional metallophosphatase/5'-nucleotidase [Acetobacterium bakii]|uniref:bifunctional metallophosphatase/5'-nucleotidase n=1 Tax=Acetobacterium bakii TaxID=52689 RepID=UPI0006821EA5|nr:bifunctional UDP-sugar hydrolase/5'-nucleotidase [Acetobacterium bakii]